MSTEPNAPLVDQRCEACRRDSPRVTPEEIAALKPQIPEWEIVERDGVPRLRRVFRFPDYRQTLAFTQRVGELAAAEDHHPTIITEWGKVTVSWWTHAIKGLHRNDFIMAAKTDEVAGR
jgi:4a-hydroxytetrahydrobiopterin dehydratase